MSTARLVFTVQKEDVGYSAFCQYKKSFMATQGDTFSELKTMILDVANLTLQDEKRTVTWEDIQLKIDLPSFFEVFGEINAKALAKRAGINNTLLSQYVSGKKTPSAKQVEKVLEGIRSLGREMANLDLQV